MPYTPAFDDAHEAGAAIRRLLLQRHVPHDAGAIVDDDRIEPCAISDPQNSDRVSVLAPVEN